jgi:hypothetical protein
MTDETVSMISQSDLITDPSSPVKDTSETCEFDFEMIPASRASPTEPHYRSAFLCLARNSIIPCRYTRAGMPMADDALPSPASRTVIVSARHGTAAK